MSGAIGTAERELIDEFAFLGDWMERYQYLIELGRALPPLADDECTDEFRLAGCQSQVWLHSDLRDGRIYFRANSDAAIVAGLIAILLRLYSGRTPAEILAAETQFVAELGLDQHLSPTRSNGLAAMLGAIRNAAKSATEG